MSTLPRTNRERPVVSNPQSSPWAFISVILAIILFGLFWLWQKKAIEKDIMSASFSSLETFQTTESNTGNFFDLNELQASAVNIPIPDFNKAL